MLKIATILPYKENYTFSKAAAASLWVYDFFKHSKFINLATPSSVRVQVML